MKKKITKQIFQKRNITVGVYIDASMMRYDNPINNLYSIIYLKIKKLQIKI